MFSEPTQFRSSTYLTSVYRFENLLSTTVLSFICTYMYVCTLGPFDCTAVNCTFRSATVTTFGRHWNVAHTQQAQHAAFLDTATCKAHQIIFEKLFIGLLILNKNL